MTERRLDCPVSLSIGVLEFRCNGEQVKTWHSCNYVQSAVVLDYARTIYLLEIAAAISSPSATHKGGQAQWRAGYWDQETREKSS